jgi:hypothetical protein
MPFSKESKYEDEMEEAWLFEYGWQVEGIKKAFNGRDTPKDNFK